ncbi:MAG: hypothetical protein MUC42_07925, partial [Bryobacter sp.]|nr:hypothetical protein [Bryobacter sp.]
MRGRTDNSELFRKAERLFEQALERPRAERAQFLRRQCGDDDRLFAEVSELLAHEGGGIEDLQAAVSRSAAEVAQTLDGSRTGQRIGAWRVTGVLGRGGMGTVYEVERADGTYQQRAALKIIRAEMDSEHGRQRFVEER